MMMRQLIPFAGDDEPPRRVPTYSAIELFEAGWSTPEIARLLCVPEATAHERVIAERCHRRRLPSPFKRLS